MLRQTMLASAMVLAASLASAASYAADKVSAEITAAVADPGRPAADKDRDADRKPAETLAFAGVKSGQQVVDFFPGGGYFTRIFSKAVGAKGHVTALWPAGTPDKFTDRTKPVTADPAYGNVTLVTEKIKDIPADSIDLFWTAQNYHDMHNLPDVDVAAVDKAIFSVIKPGGTFIVLDHAATAGSGFQDTKTLHRIDEAAVKTEVESAGFKFVGESDLLKNANDPHTAAVFDPSIRGKTDQFILKFEKPKS
jgi:predicted methyltransferase